MASPVSAIFWPTSLAVVCCARTGSGGERSRATAATMAEITLLGMDSLPCWDFYHFSRDFRFNRAESLRRARHRVDSTGTPRSGHRDQRTASPTPAAQLPRVLQRHPPASGPPQQQPPSTRSAAATVRANCRDPAGRRTSSPLSARRLIAPASPVARDVGQEDAGRTALSLAVGRSSCSTPRPKPPQQGGSVRPLAPRWSGNSFGRADQVFDRDNLQLRS